MKLITKRALASEAAAVWFKQYPVDKKGIGEKLRALGQQPCPDDVDETIGNQTWTTPPKCSECGEWGVPVVQVGEEPAYASATAYLCATCAGAVVKAFNDN